MHWKSLVILAVLCALLSALLKSIGVLIGFIPTAVILLILTSVFGKKDEHKGEEEIISVEYRSDAQ